MKRRLFLAIVLVCFVSLVLGIFVACNNNTEKQQGGSDATYYTVTFDSQGGSPVDSQRIESGKTATQPSNPTKADADFESVIRLDTLAESGSARQYALHFLGQDDEAVEWTMRSTTQ